MQTAVNIFTRISLQNSGLLKGFADFTTFLVKKLSAKHQELHLFLKFHPDSLIKRYAAFGFKERVPASSKMRQASRSGLVSLGTWFVNNYEK